MLSAINCLNFVHLCSAVPDREILEIVYKMAASGRTEVASDVKFGI